jgi:hypothetical protein
LGNAPSTETTGFGATKIPAALVAAGLHSLRSIRRIERAI